MLPLTIVFVQSHRCNTKIIISSRPIDSYLLHQFRPSLVQIMACRHFSIKPLPEPMLAYCQLDTMELISIFYFQIKGFSSRKCIRTIRRKHEGCFVSASTCWWHIEVHVHQFSRWWHCLRISNCLDFEKKISTTFTWRVNRQHDAAPLKWWGV